jgi:CelD/BcsL family acetyltransferase involved in cellulose biosynthesis
VSPDAPSVRRHAEPPSRELLTAWGDVASRAAHLTPFAHPAFAHDLPRALDHADRAEFWTTHDDAGLVAAIPFARRRQRVGGWPLVQLESLASWHASVTDVVGAPAHVAAMLRTLAASATWDLLEWRTVRPEGALAIAARQVGLRVQPDEPAHVLELDRLDALMSSGRARELRRLLRRDAELAGTHVRVVGPSDPEWAEVGHRFTALHAARWARTPTPSPLADAGLAARFVEWLGASAPMAGVSAVVLASRAGILGVLYLATAGREVHAWRLAYDRVARGIGPGMQLLQFAAVAARDQGHVRFHFGRGTQAYKTAWHTRLEERLRIRWHRPSLAFRLLDAAGRGIGRDWAAQWRATDAPLIHPSTD